MDKHQEQAILTQRLRDLSLHLDSVRCRVAAMADGRDLRHQLHRLTSHRDRLWEKLTACSDALGHDLPDQVWDQMRAELEDEWDSLAQEFEEGLASLA